MLVIVVRRVRVIRMVMRMVGRRVQGGRLVVVIRARAVLVRVRMPVCVLVHVAVRVRVHEVAVAMQVLVLVAVLVLVLVLMLVRVRVRVAVCMRVLRVVRHVRRAGDGSCRKLARTPPQFNRFLPAAAPV
ncbi:MAG: hypothetical protein LW835_13460 [Burkholderiaceae bacterium]|jgi:hypothetical protein|nr:hypothetical protein [Burkholderiales bacterium]MCE2646189.1 hypothetical protein [Burkholderiaceae bacterium]